MRLALRLFVPIVVVAAMLVTPSSAILGGSPGPVARAQEWPPVLVELSSARDGNLVLVTAFIVNRSSQDYDAHLRLRVPQGVTLLKAWAGDPESPEKRGAFDGTDVGWINLTISAGRSQGPFIAIFDTGGATLDTVAWIRFWGAQPQGDWVTALTQP